MSFHYNAFSSFTFECKSNPCMKQLPCQIKLANCPVLNTERDKCKFATVKKLFQVTSFFPVCETGTTV